MTKDVLVIIDSYFCDKDKGRNDEDEGLYVYGVWISLDRPQPSRTSIFFKELLFTYDQDASKNIMGVTVTWKKDDDVENKHRGWFNKTTTLRIYANGSYVFDLYQEEEWDHTSDEDDPGEAEVKWIRHCGVWDYERDQITMKGFGFEENRSSPYYEYDEDDHYGEVQYTRYHNESKKIQDFSSRLAIDFYYKPPSSIVVNFC